MRQCPSPPSGPPAIGLNLLDGDAEIRAWHVNVTESPLGFGLIVLIWAAATAAVAFVWWCVVLGTRADDRYRAPLDEPSNRREL